MQLLSQQHLKQRLPHRESEYATPLATKKIASYRYLFCFLVPGVYPNWMNSFPKRVWTRPPTSILRFSNVSVQECQSHMFSNPSSTSARSKRCKRFGTKHYKVYQSTQPFPDPMPRFGILQLSLISNYFHDVPAVTSP